MFINCHTFFSFKYGTLSPKELLEEACKHEVNQFAITDIHQSTAYIELFRLLEHEFAHYRPHIVLGMEFRRNHQLAFIVLAQNNKGFRNLNAYLSFLNEHKKEVPISAPELEHCHVVYPLENAHEACRLTANEWVGIRQEQLNKIRIGKFSQFRHKMVILHPVTIKNKLEHNMHRLLRAIDHNVVLSKLDRRLQANETEQFVDEAHLERQFADFPEIIKNTKSMLNMCRTNISLGTNKNKQSIHPSKIEDFSYLEKHAQQGFVKHYPYATDAIKMRFRHELDIIRKKDFTAYYLIAHDIVRYANHKGYPNVGRGSGANSIIAYCLNITQVDPIALNLYFERFLNPQRNSPPDFDIDFSWQHRDFIYDYIFRKYGKKHTALLGTHVGFKYRSLVRELCKVFGLPKEETDLLLNKPAEFDPKDEYKRLIMRYTQLMMDKELPANLSIHAGGVLISEAPIHQYIATDHPPKNLPVAHFDMYGAEDLGMYKLDILSQRGLGHIQDSIAIISTNRNEQVDPQQMPIQKLEQDPKIKALLREGRCMGCFYVESPAMRMLLGKLRCDDYLTLVAASSIIRPGVARSGMMRAYIERHHSQGNYQSVHPKMDELMTETYGVMVYQEDVIKVAHLFAGLSLADADTLRRGMSGKARSRAEMQRVRDRFFHNCKAKGYDNAITQRVWYEIESFSGYSFAKGHSASYAVESYHSLYLKAYYPLEFMVGVINNFGGFYSTEFYFHEARMAGAQIEAPCVNNSDYLTSICNITLWIGFVHLKDLQQKVAQEIVTERKARGEFKSLEDFLDRIRIGLEQSVILIRIGALRFSGKNKKVLLWQAHMYFQKPKIRNRTLPIFESSMQEFRFPDFPPDPIEEAYEQIELLGFPLCNPFELIAMEDKGSVLAQDMYKSDHQPICITGYLITTKHTHTAKGEHMHFGTFLDYHGQVFDSVHFPDVSRKFPFQGSGFYRMEGKVVFDFGYPTLEVTRMKKTGLLPKHNRLA